VIAACAASLVCLPPTNAGAQRITFVGGLTFSKLRGFDAVQAENRSGTLFGVSLNVPVGATWSLQPEALFISKGGKFGSTDPASGDQEVRLDYLEVPLLLRRNLLSSMVLVPHVYAGPTVSFNVDCSLRLRSSTTLPSPSSDCERNDFRPKTVDWGAAVGAGVDLALAGFGVTAGARYGVGLTSAVEAGTTDASDRIRNGTFAVYAGIRLFGF
jgi:hypothetical protein